MTSERQIANWWIDRPCPKCAYVRTELEQSPDWQCPGCGLVYEKYRPARAAEGPRGHPAAEGLRGRLSTGGREMAAEAKSDGSLLALVAANLAALAIGYATGMNLGDMMLVYWIQSTVIGLSAIVRILCLKRFDPTGFTVNNRPIKETSEGKRTIALFFMIHYGLFHGAYFLLVAAANRPGMAAELGYEHLVLALLFAASHGYSLARNIRRDAEGRPSPGTLMLVPYIRIVPTQLTVLVGAQFFGGAWAFFVFGLLKTAVDAMTHTAEHHLLNPRRLQIERTATFR